MYDYVIVGAGSAGCVLANRLSEDPEVQVLLVEAGGSDANDLIQVPAAFSALYRTAVDWDHATGPEAYANGRRIFLPRGKVLGGSSSLNAMIYIRGNPADYDAWRDAGCESWGFDDLLPYFRRVERNERGADEWHGADGPLSVSDARARNPLAEAFLESAAATGHPRIDDFNAGEQDGVGWYQLTERDGRRESCATAYLHPVEDRPNLTIETHVQILRVLFEGQRAVGVAGVRLDEELEFRAAREVVLCAGAYGSPQLLMLSGIGRREELEPLEIEPVLELPGVGLNLQDHPNAGVIHRIGEEISLFGALNPENLARLMGEGQGPLTSNIAEAGGFMRSREGLPGPDLQFHFAPGVFQHEGLIPAQEHGFSIGACLLTPQSRGYVALVSPDPTAKPLIVHNYLEHPDDRATMVAGVRACMEIAATEPLASYDRGPINTPASDSEDDILAHLAATLQTLYHPVGTSRMGVDELAVVDPELRVHGLEGLRVVDASVMPTVTRGNTNAPTIAIAERAADLMRHGVAEGSRTVVAG
jgi:choline dehydrogenase